MLRSSTDNLSVLFPVPGGWNPPPPTSQTPSGLSQSTCGATPSPPVTQTIAATPSPPLAQPFNGWSSERALKPDEDETMDSTTSGDLNDATVTTTTPFRRIIIMLNGVNRVTISRGVHFLLFLKTNGLFSASFIFFSSFHYS